MEDTTEKVIEFDSDISPECDNKEEVFPYNPEYDDIKISDTPFSVFEYLRLLDKGKIKMQPDFQRNQVWTHKQKSKFIESVLLNFPLPPIYLNETTDSGYIVIDGLQRTSTLDDFYKGSLKLEELEALPKYNGCSFEELPETLQARFERQKLTVFTLKPSTPMVVIYDLFNRINTGGTQLNRQEVRNCIYTGASTKLLKNLSEEEYFKSAIDWGVKGTRMKDREVVLRYIAFRWFREQKEYSGNMSDYIESAMKNINAMTPPQLEEIEKDFKRVMEYSFSMWGNRNFSIPTEKTRGVINIAVFETVCCFLASKDDSFLRRNQVVVKDNYEALISNLSYLDAVTRATGNKLKVSERFKLVHEILEVNTI